MTDSPSEDVGAKVDGLSGRVDLTHSDNREILRLLTKLVEDGAKRETDLRSMLREVNGSLKEMTAAFREQSETVGKVLDLRQRVRDLEDELERERETNRIEREKLAELFREAEEKNNLARSQLGGLLKILLYGGGAVAAAVALAVVGLVGPAGK